MDRFRPERARQERRPADTKVNRTILLIEDDEDAGWFLTRLFEREGWTTLRATDGSAGFSLFESESPDVVLLDLKLPGIGGLDLLQILRKEDPDVGVVVLTGHGDISTAVEAMHHGAANFLSKPVDNDHLLAAVQRAYEMVRLRRQNRSLAERTRLRSGIEQLGESPPMREVARQIEVIAATDSTVLLEGETGTGKSWVAQLIHSRSPRAAKPCVEVNCAGLNATFLDPELFGHEKGAFTDAKSQKRGLFEIADGGTLFLDEIGDLAPELQPKLLKVLETRKFRRLGSTREIEADVRLIAATNRPLAQDAQSGKFRSDLYYRLAIFPITLPPLRERSAADIASLCYALLHSLRRRLGRGPTRFSPEALAVLAAYTWPGNIRELRNVLERSVILSAGAEEIQPQDLPGELMQSRVSPRVQAADSRAESLWSLAELERQHIMDALQYCRGNRVHAARLLCISRRTLYSKLQRYGVAGIGGNGSSSLTLSAYA